MILEGGGGGGFNRLMCWNGIVQYRHNYYVVIKCA